MLLTLIFNVCAAAKPNNIPQHTDRFFINDYADVIDAETENYIYETGKAYHANGGPQIVVLTMPSIEGESLEDFSIETARQWGIGQKDQDNGVLILLVLDSRDIRIEVGYGLEGTLNDGKCGRFIRNAKDQLSSGDYSGGIKHIYDDIIGELENPTPDEDDDDSDFIYELIFYAVLLVIFMLIAILAKKGGGSGKSGGSYSGGHYSSGHYFGGSSGGFGGGGGGFSGGGGGFSGGGGSFGGGGASGKF